MADNGYNIYRPGSKRLVLMVSNKRFAGQHENRQAALTDNDYNVFTEFFGFDSCSKEGKDYVVNASKEDLEKELEYVKTKLDEEDVSCLAVILSSHGWEKIKDKTRSHYIICSDGKEYRTLDIIEKFQTRKAIPVIFVIQACRRGESQQPEADRIDPGITIEVVSDDSDEEFEAGTDAVASVDTSGAGRFEPSRYGERSLIPACAPHTSVLFSSSEGKDSYLGPYEGSWILHSLHETVKKMKENGMDNISLFELFVRVNCKMSEMETKHPDKKKAGLKSASCFLHQMSKNLVLKIQSEGNA